MKRPGCEQPDPLNEKQGYKVRRPRDCSPGKDHCLCRVYEEARQECIDRGEGWRWGVGSRKVGERS